MVDADKFWENVLTAFIIMAACFFVVLVVWAIFTGSVYPLVCIGIIVALGLVLLLQENMSWICWFEAALFTVTWTAVLPYVLVLLAAYPFSKSARRVWRCAHE